MCFWPIGEARDEYPRKGKQEVIINVVVATTGRSEIVRQTVSYLLASQSRKPDKVIVVGAQDDDISLVVDMADVMAAVSPKGSCAQRNRGIDLSSDADVIVFFDDDFVAAPDYLAQLERHFTNNRNLVGMTGALLADGAHTGAISFADARRLVENGDPDKADEQATYWLYGCNMAYRRTAAPTLRFDEKLPFYGWQEDVDFSHGLGLAGEMIKTSALTGVHMGSSNGRTSGTRFGYSQVANIVYLRKKGTIKFSHGYKLMTKNIASNLVKSIRPEENIDRRGRLRGNARAFFDLARGKSCPTNIVNM